MKKILAMLLVFVLLCGLCACSDGGSETPDGIGNDEISEIPGVIKSGENWIFDITYDEFCQEMVEVFSVITGATEDAVIKYCNEIPVYDGTLDYYAGNLDKYEIGLEASQFSNALFVLKVEVYVEPETEKVVTVSVFKANGSSTLDNFNMLANKASLILSGRIVGEMDDCLVKTIDQDWEQLHYFEYEGCGMEFEQQKSGVSGGDLRRLNVYPAESFEIPE